MNNQDLIRKKCRFLKWNKNISYNHISNFLDMNVNSFYNFMSGNANLSHRKILLINEMFKNEQRDLLE